jgi:aminopeptidase C
MRTNIHKRGVEQPILPIKAKKAETKIVSLTVHKEKLTAQLDDGRELSIPIDWFSK